VLGQFDVYAVAIDGAIWWTHDVPGYPWSGAWAKLNNGTSNTSSLSVGADLRPDGLEDVFTIGSSDNAEYHAIVRTALTSPSPPYQVLPFSSDFMDGGLAGSAHGVWNGAELDTYEIDGNGAVYSKVGTATGWTGYYNISNLHGAGTYTAVPNLRLDGSTNEDLFLEGTDGAAWVATMAIGAQAANPVVGMGGSIVGAPAGAWNPTIGYAFVLGTDYKLYRATSSGGAWGGWADRLASPPPGPTLGSYNVNVTVH
jgi:hypothetical protein